MEGDPSHKSLFDAAAAVTTNSAPIIICCVGAEMVLLERCRRNKYVSEFLTSYCNSLECCSELI